MEIYFSLFKIAALEWLYGWGADVPLVQISSTLSQLIFNEKYEQNK